MLPPLPYPYNALEPHIDAKTMQIHHDKHHQAYVNNLNAALKDTPTPGQADRGTDRATSNALPEAIRTAVRNNGGGHANHSLFWQIMKPGGGGEPTGELAQAIDARSRRVRRLQGGASTPRRGTRFGSGWAWLVVGKDGKLAVTSTPNQDSPLMDGQHPRARHRRLGARLLPRLPEPPPRLLTAWWNTVNWDEVASATPPPRPARSGLAKKGRPAALYYCCSHQAAMSKRSRFITLVQAATKSCTNFSFASALA